MVDLYYQIRRSWGADTSASDAWSEANPALGQCAVTALVIQDHLGGVLLRCTVGGVSHYWNQLFVGVEVDLTFEQFPEDSRRENTITRDRDYVLSFPETVARYDILRGRVG